MRGSLFFVFTFAFYILNFSLSRDLDCPGHIASALASMK